MSRRPEGPCKGVATGDGLIVPFTREVLVGEAKLAPGELETMLGHLVPAGIESSVVAKRLVSQWPDLLRSAKKEAMQPVKETEVVQA